MPQHFEEGEGEYQISTSRKKRSQNSLGEQGEKKGGMS